MIRGVLLLECRERCHPPPPSHPRKQSPRCRLLTSREPTVDTKSAIPGSGSLPVSLQGFQLAPLLLLLLLLSMVSLAQDETGAPTRRPMPPTDSIGLSLTCAAATGPDSHHYSTRPLLQRPKLYTASCLFLCFLPCRVRRKLQTSGSSNPGREVLDFLISSPEFSRKT